MADDDDNPEWTEANARPPGPDEKLLILRARLRLSQADLAALLGTAPALVRDWEDRRATPDGPARTLIELLYQDPAGIRDRLAHLAA